MTHDRDLEAYIAAHTSPEPMHLARLNRDTHVSCLYPDMCSGHLQGRLLKMLTAIAAPRRVLELGTFTGYSALCIAEALPEGAELHTVEINDEMEDFIRAHLEASPAGACVTLHIGAAEEVVERLGGEWDMVFVDANKRDYPSYYRMLMPRLRPGGMMIADNTLWYGKVANPDARDAQTLGIRAFNDMAAADPGAEVVFIPVRDGLSVIRKLG